jgi:hypothetical protein
VSPFNAETGTVWVYNVARAQEKEIDAATDGEAVFIVLDGVVTSDDNIDRGRKYRRAMSLITGQPENFTSDSRLNTYSDPLL